MIVQNQSSMNSLIVSKIYLFKIEISIQNSNSLKKSLNHPIKNQFLLFSLLKLKQNTKMNR